MTARTKVCGYAGPRKSLLLILIAVIFLACISVWWARGFSHTDFPAYYRAAKIIMDDTVPDTEIYRTDDLNIVQYGIPEDEAFVAYRYSMFATYLIAPLALFSYDTANAIMIFVNIVLYLAAVLLILRLCGAKDRWLFYPLLLSLYWMPFLENTVWNQVNGIIIFLIAITVILLSDNKWFAAGVCLAVASLFKPFVLPITMVLCIKNWRIAVSYLALLCVALFLLPGAREWYHSFLWPPHSYYCYSAVYHLLGGIYFWVYAAAVGGLTALVTFFNRVQDYLALTSLAMPAALLAMPVMEVHFPTILILSFIFIISCRPKVQVLILTALSFVLIYIGSSTTILIALSKSVDYTGAMLYLGVLALWIAMMKMIIDRGKNEETTA